MENVQCKNCLHLKNDWCGKKHDSPYPEIVRDCDYYQRMTNADRIRAMTDEELAVTLPFPQCPPHEGKCTFSTMKANSCDECWLDWLRQKVTE